MFLLTSEEAAVFELLDPATSRRLVIGRTGRAFVWDPISSTREVPLEAAQSLVKAGIVGTGGRIAPEHLHLWCKPAAQSRKPVAIRAAAAVPKSAEKPAAKLPDPPVRGGAFERTLPLGYSADALRAM